MSHPHHCASDSEDSPVSYVNDGNAETWRRGNFVKRTNHSHRHHADSARTDLRAMIATLPDKLDSNMRLAELPVSNVSVHSDTQTSELQATFENDASMPGIIVQNGAVLVGVVSRSWFLEQMNRPFWRDVFFRRPVAIAWTRSSRSKSCCCPLPRACTTPQVWPWCATSRKSTIR